jgi:dipeptidyl aminopeptidase/acylaminoacyl peptidase
MKPSGLRTDDLDRLTLISDPDVSREGVVAFVRSWLDSAADMTRHEVMIASPAAAVRRLPARSANAWCPHWSPDGARLAMISTASGQAEAVIWTRGSGAPSGLAQVSGQACDLSWSPDGTALAVTTVTIEPPGDIAWIMHPAGPARIDGAAGLARERRRVWILPADGSPGHELAVGRQDDTWQPRWSPDGARLAVLTGPPGGPVRLCVARPTPAGLAASTPLATAAVAFCWSPDGTQIAYLAPRPGEFPDVECRLYRCSAAGGGEPVELAAGWDRSLGGTVRGDDARGTTPGPPLWSAATGRIYFCVADGGEGGIGWASPDSGGHGLLCGGRRTCLEPSLSDDGRRIAFVSTDPADPGTVRTVDLETGSELRLTDVDAWVAAAVTPTGLVTARGQDGVPLEAWLTLPADRSGGLLPLIVSLHGGPHYPVGWRFCFEAQRLAARGYAVLTPNPRGSGGYGRDFATAIRGQWASLAWQDVSCLMDAAMASHAIDGDRVGVTGVSYGGFLSLHAITVSPRIRTAICENGISNLLGLWGSGAEDPDWLSAEMGGPPWEQPGAYAQMSPLTAVASICAPVLLIHAELDQNCPISQSEQMLAAIRRCGGEAQLLRLDGEGHLVNLVGRPSRRFARALAVDRWLDLYLSPSPAGPGPGSGSDRSQQHADS